jgi:outer membrane protein insertion porin family
MVYAWEKGDEIIGEVLGKGFVLQKWEEIKNRLRSRVGQPFSPQVADQDVRELFKTGLFEQVHYRKEPIPGKASYVRVIFIVKEYKRIKRVQIHGVKTQNLKTLQGALRLGPGKALDPELLKRDSNSLRVSYLTQGYHFVDVNYRIEVEKEGVILSWHIREGPRVTVEEIQFSGNLSVSPSVLKEQMLTKENTLFSSAPFVESILLKDLERIKLYYQREGWLDITAREPKVFVEDLIFNDEKTRVVIKIHIEEGERYRVKRLIIEGNTLFSEEEVKEWILIGEGDYYSERLLQQGITTLREKYIERAYLNVQITPEEIFILEQRAVDLRIHINENQKTYMGKLTILGNKKTRDDVIRRYFRIYPGDDFDLKKIREGINRLRDTGWFTPDGLNLRFTKGEEQNMQDLILEVKEAQTGHFRFAAGVSSRFGFVGLFEFVQRNFDISDLPKSLDDLPNSFQGGGQYLKIRVAPGVERSSNIFDFREPFVFGHEFGLGIRAFDVTTIWESYDEHRDGARLGLEKRWEDLSIALDIEVLNIDINDLEPDAPYAVRDVEGKHSQYSLGPSLNLDTRDSIIFPTQGFRLGLSHEYVGGILPGDFDFVKTTLSGEYFLTLYTTEEKFKHVLSFKTTVGLASPTRGQDDLPTFERYFAGGRGSIRGFKYRGVGPRQNGDPIGGNFLTFASIEYGFPIYRDTVRGVLFYDIANLAPKLNEFHLNQNRMSIGLGIRLIVPYLGNIPFAIDIGFPITKEPQDETETITADLGIFY